MSDWITPPGPPVLASRAQPYLMVPERLGAFDEAIGSRAHRVRVDIGAASSASDVVAALQRVLPFPEWCGAGWDSVEDSFEEIRSGWQFPLVLLVEGLDRLISSDPQLGLETVVRLSDLARAFSVSADQLLVVYLWPSS